ncbi:MAG: SET domain-containing protein [Alphaproteobacteria bacterium]|nr:SET domain-containing protein [Alphaproteobacteria bacterium]
MRNEARRYLPRSWIHPDLAAGPSRIHGVGVIARRDFAAGERLMEFGGHAIGAAEVESDLYRTRSIWLVREGLWLALPESDPEPSLDENLNHSCDANAWLADEVTLVARRDISAGEEITLDQGTWNLDDEYVWDQEACSCGARDCREVLTPQDWKLAAVKKRYRGHFHPVVQGLIEAEPAKVPAR